MRLNNLQKLIDKYSESLTLGELQIFIQKEQEIRGEKQQKVVYKFIEKYKNRYLRVENIAFENDIEFIHVLDIEFESMCEDMETLCFKVIGEKIQSTIFPGIREVDDVRLYSNREYQIISKEEYENVRSIVNKFLNDIKQH